LVATVPESTASYPGFKDDAEFRFNEIVNEGSNPNFGLGSGDLEKLVLLSPSDEVPSVGWKRSRIVVRPKEGWRPNRVYRIELLPGIADLRNNRSANGRIITFTTGAPVPTRFLEGRVVDWTSRRPEPRGLVVATLLPDSLPYRTVADSTGRFRLGPLPAGQYLVAGVLDQNRNNQREARENFDTLTVAADRDSVGELWAYRQDTVAARLQSAAVNDSLSVAVQFNQHLNPFQQLSPDSVRVRRLPDSIDLGVEAVLTKERYDSVYGRAPRTAADSARADSAAVKARADSIARADSLARADSIRRARQQQLAPGARRRGREMAPVVVDNAPLTTKPPLFDRLVVRAKEQLVPGLRYVVQFGGIQNVSGIAGQTRIGFEVPRPRPADTAGRETPRAGPPPSPAPPPPPPPPPSRTPGRPPR
jgi:hypothetical protein